MAQDNMSVKTLPVKRVLKSLNFSANYILSHKKVLLYIIPVFILV